MKEKANVKKFDLFDLKTKIDSFILSLNKNNYELDTKNLKWLFPYKVDYNTINHFYRFINRNENIILILYILETDDSDTYMFVYKDLKLYNKYFGTIDTVIENYSKENLNEI